MCFRIKYSVQSNKCVCLEKNYMPVILKEKAICINIYLY